MTSKEIRAKFLDFFEEKNHKIVPSAPIVNKEDPTLMFTNAGMNQFKEFFLGLSKAPKNRIANTQKCLRVSGKHNDLEEVGKDTYHHTMFEMLGNWSFGDYFKDEAIAWGWDLLNGVFDIPAEDLYVTYFEGSSDGEDLEPDQEAYDHWKKIIPEARIIPGNKKDNFWEMGDQGPCGPCSEIHVDLRSAEEKKKIPGATLVNKDHPLVIELWNLVFIQYNRKADGSLESLPEKHVDTGMGFERLCMVLQGKLSNYDTDVFQPLIQAIEKMTGTAYGKDEETDIAIRVIADHIRAVAFAIADGQLPSNTGAGYVIRRILRRAVRYGFTFLGIKEPFMHKLVNVLEDTMGGAFPELSSQKRLLENVIREEEQSFLKTLEQGLALLDEAINKTKGKELQGSRAFELYDTFGFPKDLTALILEERGMSLDEAGFEKSMQEQKDRSKAASEIARADWTVVLPDAGSEFLGYDSLESESRIAKFRKVTSKKAGSQFQVVLDRTPFYAEGGGQVGDKGYMELPNGDVIYVLDTKRENNEIVHMTSNLPDDPSIPVRAVVDERQRILTARNHSATHLLHQALREVLGDHVEQKGSAVHSNYLRFDFSHYTKMSAEEIEEVESFVNERIKEQIPLEEKRQIPMAQAQAEGAIALFGEKYGDTVRTVRFGKSIELCGGTHVQNTADIWHFKITSEGAIAAGIRRIEAITSDAVRAYFLENSENLRKIEQLFKGSQDPVTAVQKLQEEHEELKKQFETVERQQALGLKDSLQGAFEDKNGVKFLAKKVDLKPAMLKDLAFSLAESNDQMFLLLASESDNKASLACYISKPLVKERGYHAGNIIRELGKHIKGGGGGQPFFATAGGKDPAGIPNALKAFESYL